MKSSRSFSFTIEIESLEELRSLEGYLHALRARGSYDAYQKPEPMDFRCAEVGDMLRTLVRRALDGGSE